jgi:hypothetical protein
MSERLTRAAVVLTRLFGRDNVAGQSEKGGTMAGSREDAMLVVELSKLGAMMRLDEASRDLFADDFDPETADVSDPSVQRILFYYETIGTLVKNGLLDRDLVYDWVWAEGIWKRVGPAAERAREKAGAAELYENFEALAAGQRLGAPA